MSLIHNENQSSPDSSCFQDALFLQLFDNAICSPEHGDPGRNTRIDSSLKHRFLYLEFSAAVVSSSSASFVNEVISKHWRAPDLKCPVN